MKELIIFVIIAPILILGLPAFTDISRRGYAGVLLALVVIGAVLGKKTYAELTVPVEEKPCNIELSSTEYANALRRLSDLKEICGHMEDHERFEACTQNPMLPQLNNGSCVAVKNITKEIHSWVGARASELYPACKQQGPCMRWAETAKSWDGTPVLE